VQSNWEARCVGLKKASKQQIIYYERQLASGAAALRKSRPTSSIAAKNQLGCFQQQQRSLLLHSHQMLLKLRLIASRKIIYIKTGTGWADVDWRRMLQISVRVYICVGSERSVMESQQTFCLDSIRKRGEGGSDRFFIQFYLFIVAAKYAGELSICHV